MVMSVPRASGQSGQTTQAPKPASKNPVVTRPQTTPPAPDVATHRAVVDQYCVVCHNAKLKTANLLLDQLDLAHLTDHAEIGEKVVRKLRAGMMPPSGMSRPDPETRQSLITWMESELDRKAAANLTPPG